LATAASCRDGKPPAACAAALSVSRPRVRGPAICHLYLDVRITPVQHPGAVQRDLEAALAAAGVPATVVPFVYRRGYEAQNVEPLVKSIEDVHERLFGERPSRPINEVTSMWRDSNVFNAAGIPTVIYGPGTSIARGDWSMEISALVGVARAYAGIALEVCGVAE
jgi:acetylornithine deacetylase/succinyl-diaminopimelate desuccinylase-like protein